MTTKLIITNTRSRLENLPLDIARELVDVLSFQVPNFWFSGAFKSGKWDGYQRFFDRPRNVFPTGLLPIVVEILKKHKVKCIVTDTREHISPSILPEDYRMMSNKTLRDYQTQAANNLLSHKLLNIPFLRGVINIATNGGKTVIAEAIIDQILPCMKSDDRLLFLTHSKEIGYQAAESISQDLGVSVGFIGDGKWDEQLITVALIPTIYKQMKSKQCKELLSHTIGFIADEVHHASSDTWYSTLLKLENAYIRIGLTGTVDKTDEIKEHKLYAVTGNILTKISNEFLIKNGYSAKPKCLFTFIREPELSKKSYEECYTEGIVNNMLRNQTITKIIERERKLDANILILVERTEHGNLLYDLIKDMPDVGNVQFTHGECSTKFRKQVLKDLKDNKVQVLIATAVLDEGVDADNINSVIYARGMKSSRKQLQGIGRGLRKKKDGSGLTYYDFIDDTCEYLLEHSLQRYETVKKEGFEITKLEV